MKMLDLQRVIRNLYATGATPHLIGPPGVGKSEFIRSIPGQLSEHYGQEFGYWEITAPTYDAPDVRGFIIPHKNAETNKPESITARSPVMPSEKYLEKYKRGIFFIDELNQSDMLMQKALSGLMLEGRAGDVVLPRLEKGKDQGWMIIAASNRTSDKAGVIKPPMHNVNRQCILGVDPDVVSWATMFAEPNKLHPMGIAYAKKHSGVFAAEMPAKEDPYCTFRSYTRAIQYLAHVAGTDSKGNPIMTLPNDSLSMEIVGGYIGPGNTAQLFAFFKLADELPDFEDILKDPASAKCPKRLDAAYAAVQMCLHYANGGNVDSIWEYTERLPAELQVSAASSLIKASGGALLNSKKLGQWVTKNRALITNVMSN
jgi:hypothetical protein